MGYQHWKGKSYVACYNATRNPIRHSHTCKTISSRSKLDQPRLRGKFSTDTENFKCTSLRGNIASQVYFHKCGFYAVYHLLKVDDAHVGPTLPSSISEFGIPEQLMMDGAAVQVGRKTTFMDTIRRANIDHLVPIDLRRIQQKEESMNSRDNFIIL